MRHIKSFSRRAAAFTLSLLLSLPIVYADAGERVLQTSTEITGGLTYRNTVTVNGGSRVESFALELEPDNQRLKDNLALIERAAEQANPGR